MAEFKAPAKWDPNSPRDRQRMTYKLDAYQYDLGIGYWETSLIRCFEAQTDGQGYCAFTPEQFIEKTRLSAIGLSMDTNWMVENLVKLGLLTVEEQEDGTTRYDWQEIYRRLNKLQMEEKPVDMLP